MQRRGPHEPFLVGPSPTPSNLATAHSFVLCGIIQSMSTDYQPSGADLMWATNMINAIKDGGVLGMPSTGLAYVLDHKVKTLTVLTMGNDDDEARETHARTIVVFGQLGYAVGGVKEIQA